MDVYKNYQTIYDKNNINIIEGDEMENINRKKKKVLYNVIDKENKDPDIYLDNKEYILNNIEINS